MSIDLSAKELAYRLGKPSASGNGWQCCCPAHDDNNPSLAIYDRPSGRPFVKCMAGCDFRDVRAALIALGLWSDERKARPASRAQQAIKSSMALCPIPFDAVEPDFPSLVGWTPTAIYRYLDAEGRLLHLIVRHDRDDGPKEMRPIIFVKDTDGKTSWRAKGPAEPRPLYGLDLLAARPNDPVLVVEGEKAADAARDRFKDHVVVTWSGGANAVGKADWAPLRDREVVLWPDNDDAGKKAMQLAAAVIKKAG